MCIINMVLSLGSYEKLSSKILQLILELANGPIIGI